MLLKNLHQATLKKALFSKLLLLLWPLYQLSQLPNSRFYLLDLIVFLAVAFQIKKICHSGLSRINPLLKPLAIFLSVATVSLLLAAPWQKTALLYLLRIFLYSSLLLISLPKKTPFLLNISFFIVPVLGLLQYAFFPDLRFLKGIGYDDHYYRLIFPFLDPNYTGAVLTFIFLYSMGSIKKTSSKVLLGLSLPALALTFSRTSFLSLFVGLIYLFLKKPKLRLSLILTSLGLGLLIFLSPKPFGEGVNLKRTFSVTARVSNLKEGLSLFTSNPIVGVGYNTLPFSQDQRSSAGLDNSLVFILATTGLTGLISFLYLLFKAWVLTSNLYLKAALLSLFVHGLSNNTLFYAPITILVFLFLNSSARRSPL